MFIYTNKHKYTHVHTHPNQNSSVLLIIGVIVLNRSPKLTSAIIVKIQNVPIQNVDRQSLCSEPHLSNMVGKVKKYIKEYGRSPFYYLYCYWLYCS